MARRIVGSVKARIHAGLYRAGDRLPSTRAFAVEWGCSRTTVTAAYGHLIAEGYLQSRTGARAVVAAGLVGPPSPPDRPPDRPPHLSAFAGRLLTLSIPPSLPPPRITDFRYGDLSASDFPSLVWRRALNAAMLRRGGSLRYGEPQGSGGLRAALAGYLWRTRGIACEADDIVVVNGSQQGLDLSARLLLDPGDRFVMENPGYWLARHAFLAAGGVPVLGALDADGLVTDGLPPARLAYVTPSHQYPLGAVLSATRRRALVAWANDADAFVVEDDYDGEYRHDIAPIPPLQTLAPERVIFLGTLSKTLSPMLRLGFLVAPASLRAAFAHTKRLTDRHTPQPEQDALTTLLASGAYERHVRTMRKRNAERRAALLDALAATCGSAVRIVGAETGLHVVAWCDGVPAERETALAEAARDAGIGLYPASSLYDPAGGRPEQAGFVLGYAGLDAPAIRRGVATLASVLGSFR